MGKSDFPLFICYIAKYLHLSPKYQILLASFLSLCLKHNPFDLKPFCSFMRSCFSLWYYSFFSFCHIFFQGSRQRGGVLI